MRKLLYNKIMQIPDYTITNRIVKMISEIERARGYIENTFVLPFSQKSLKKESMEKKVYNLILQEDLNLSLTDIKKHFDSVSPHLDEEVLNVIEILNNLEVYSKSKSSWNLKILNLCEKISGTKKIYRIKKIPNKPMPDEILSKMTVLNNWVESDDAKATHPLIVASIILCELDLLEPFEKFPFLTNSLITNLYLSSQGFSLIEIIPFEEINNVKRYKYIDELEYVNKNQDFTKWVEFFLEGINLQMNILKEKYELLENQSKQNSIPMVEKLTSRQQRLYQYLMDYKFIQNSQFSILFPDISEDSILRDLKALVELDLIVKTGKTKSSKYEIKH